MQVQRCLDAGEGDRVKRRCEDAEAASKARLRCRASGVPLVLRLLWADGWCFRGGRAGAQGDEDLSAAGCARAGVWRAACAAARGGRATRRAACCSAAACAP
jgi:hypothetical protein